jgi:mono/diheme cytochrome c family protein
MKPNSSKSCLLFFALLLTPALLFSSFDDDAWVKHVPSQDRDRQNPVAADPSAVVVGEKLFTRNCASCHGKQAQGRGKRPNLHSDIVRNASDGELEWLLRNGSLKRGMPSWSRIPEQQRWQLVAFLKSLR